MREGKVLAIRINIFTKRLHFCKRTYRHKWKCTGALSDKSEVSEFHNKKCVLVMQVIFALKTETIAT
jgi:hypothetical protein